MASSDFPLLAVLGSGAGGPVQFGLGGNGTVNERKSVVPQGIAVWMTKVRAL